MREPQALSALRRNSRQLINSMDIMQYFGPQERGRFFVTGRGEPALVSKYGHRGMEILVNGRPVLRGFIDDHYPGDTHMMMEGPDGHMYAGRLLPSDYLAEANSLVGSAQLAISGGGILAPQRRH